MKLLNTGWPATASLLLIGLVWMVGNSVLAAESGSAVQEIQISLKDRKIQPEQIVIRSGTPVLLVVTNEDNTSEEIESKALRLEKLVPPKKTVKIHLAAQKPGEYDLFGDFHPETAKAILKVE